ncbi:c-type cytochrome [Prosthecomicrobium sp. N25]|uniref:c-type cytochrome n=1 Tax=Prosthecomicrobium sp. N25 TaxID=3129254 RepID=UPI0030776492
MVPNRKTLAGLVSAAVMLAATGAVAQDRDRELRGKEIAEAACSPCHAIGKQGASPNPASPPFRTLGQKYPVESLEEALAEGILVGHPGMPQVRMSPEDIGAFLAYLKTVQVEK